MISIFRKSLSANIKMLRVFVMMQKHGKYNGLTFDLSRYLIEMPRGEKRKKKIATPSDIFKRT